MQSKYLSTAQPESMPAASVGLPDWREILTIVMERFWYGLAVSIVVFLVVFFQMLRAVPYYQSTAVLMVEVNQPQLLGYREVVSSDVRSLDYFNTVITLLHSRQMMESALAHSGLAENPDFFPHLEGIPRKASAALRLVRITPVDRSRLIRIQVEHTAPAMASALANAMAYSYIQQDLDTRMGASMQAVEWLRERADEFRGKLEAGMLGLQEYREEAQSVSLEEDQNIVLAKLKSLNTTLSAAQAERIRAQSEWEAIKQQMDAGVSRQRIAPQLADSGLHEVLSQLTRHQRELARLRQRYREDHPDLREALQQEEVLQAAFEDAFETAMYAVESRYHTLLTHEQNFLQALRDQEQEAFLLSRQLVQYNDLRRNVEADKEIYESVIGRMKEANVSGTLPAEVIRIAEEAHPAGRPFRPNRARTLLRGGVFAVVAGFGVIFLLYYADHRFRRNEEVERSLGVPVLASLPIISGADIRERGLVSFLHPTGEVAEGFRTLRAILGMNPVMEKAKVLLVTSSQPSEGKSLISVNLAISYVQDDRRTLLIGADMRRPAFRKIFAEQDHPCGLAEVLCGEAQWQDVVQSGEVPGLDVLGAGKMGERPAEMLGGYVFSRLLDEMRATYDRIIIDAPPVLGVSDTLVLLKNVDGLLFVVRYGLTHSLGAGQAMRRIKASGVPCLGTVMNGVDLRSLANYYYYRRYGGYAYAQYTNAGAHPSFDDVAVSPHDHIRRAWKWGVAKIPPGRIRNYVWKHAGPPPEQPTSKEV